MDNLCSRCGVCCKYIPVDVRNRILLRDSKKILTEEFEAMLIPQTGIVPTLSEIYPSSVIYTDLQFFRCKYLLNENICSNPNKPQECKEFPNSPIACVPEDCGYAGVQFLKNEEFKQKIRKMKEEILHYEALLTEEPKNEHSYKMIIERLKKYIEKYSIFGSEDW